MPTAPPPLRKRKTRNSIIRPKKRVGSRPKERTEEDRGPRRRGGNSLEGGDDLQSVPCTLDYCAIGTGLHKLVLDCLHICLCIELLLFGQLVVCLNRFAEDPQGAIQLRIR